MNTRIRVAGIRFEGQHGVSAAERSLTRRFEVDVELTAGLEAAQGSDRLADTVDYADVARVIVSTGTGPSLHLLEALARRMVDALAERWPEVAITLEVRKLEPPHCPGTPAFSAVQLTQAAARERRGRRRRARPPAGRRRKG